MCAAAAPFCYQLGHGAHTGEECAAGLVRGVGLCVGRDVGQPLHQQLRAEEGEHVTGAGLGVQAVGEVGFYPGAFPQEGQGPAPCGQTAGQALGVAARLHFYAGEGCALFFGFDHAAGFAVDIEQVVGKTETVVEGEFADGDTNCRMDIRVRYAADVPTGLHKQCVDADSGFLLWRHAPLPPCFSILGYMLNRPPAPVILIYVATN